MTVKFGLLKFENGLLYRSNFTRTGKTFRQKPRNVGQGQGDGKKASFQNLSLYSDDFPFTEAFLGVVPVVDRGQDSDRGRGAPK